MANQPTHKSDLAVDGRRWGRRGHAGLRNTATTDKGRGSDETAATTARTANLRWRGVGTKRLDRTDKRWDREPPWSGGPWSASVPPSKHDMCPDVVPLSPPAL